MLNVKLCSQRCVFGTKSNICDGAFYAKIVNGLQHSLVNVWLGSKYASGSLDAPCETAPLNSFTLQYLCHNQFVFCFRK